VAFQTELEQALTAAVYAQIFSPEAEDRLYDEGTVDLHLELAVGFQGQSPSLAAAYGTIEESLQEDTHPHLYSCQQTLYEVKRLNIIPNFSTSFCSSLRSSQLIEKPRSYTPFDG
jgi:hypothetical protein